MAQRAYPYSFVKWVGGKSKMARHILERLPLHFNRYFEPFLGGGAVFFELSRQKRFKRASLGDMNPELMNAFRTVQDDVSGLIRELHMDCKYIYNKKTYLKIRAQDTKDWTPVARAARFIYLNKTCFNGLYRVNGSGKFNVPFGTYKDPVICDEPNLRAVSKALKNVKLIEKRFEWVLQLAKPGDAVYFDPPYLPISETSKFTGYTEGGFGLVDHTFLSCVFDELANRGVAVVLSNSTAARELYKKHEIVDLVGGRSVGGPAEYRKPVKEIMVVANCRPVISLEEHVRVAIP
jgi:DNA adenine methylase